MASLSSSSTSSTILTNDDTATSLKNINKLATLMDLIVNAEVDCDNHQLYSITSLPSSSSSSSTSAQKILLFNVDNQSPQPKRAVMNITFGNVISSFSQPANPVEMVFSYPGIPFPGYANDLELLAPESSVDLLFTIPSSGRGIGMARSVFAVTPMALGIPRGKIRNDYHLQINSISASIISEPTAASVGIKVSTTGFQSENANISNAAAFTGEIKDTDLIAFNEAKVATLLNAPLLPMVTAAGKGTMELEPRVDSVSSGSNNAQRVDVHAIISSGQSDFQFYKNPLSQLCNPMSRRFALWNINGALYHMVAMAEETKARELGTGFTATANALEVKALREIFEIADAKSRGGKVTLNAELHRSLLKDVIMIKTPYTTAYDISEIYNSSVVPVGHVSSTVIDVLRCYTFSLNKIEQLRAAYKPYYDLLLKYAPSVATALHQHCVKLGVARNSNTSQWAPTPFVAPPGPNQPVYFIFFSQIFKWIGKFAAETYGSEKQFKNVDNIWFDTTRVGELDKALQLHIKLKYSQIRDNVHFMGLPEFDTPLNLMVNPTVIGPRSGLATRKG